MGMKKVLLFTGKFPSITEDRDGGSMLVNSIINALSGKCELDIIFTRTPREEIKNIPGINEISFETYKYHLEDKFKRRLANKKQLLRRLKKEIEKYDVVIITHCSKAFGVEKLKKNERNKIILFPMYLSTSYARSSEEPPKEYIVAERKALHAVKKIITPSNSEKNDMVSEFGVDESKIVVIPRGYSSLIKQEAKTISSPLQLLYIASIKEQKNTLESIVLLKELKALGVEVVLNLVGGYQDAKLLTECKRYISENNLQDDVIFHGVLSQYELAGVISKCYINISVSNWETYGRGIFEGMAGGLPTIVYEHIDCVKEYVIRGSGIVFVKEHKDFLHEIFNLYNNCKYYEEQSKKAIDNVFSLSEKEEIKKLLRELI